MSKSKNWDSINIVRKQVAGTAKELGREWFSLGGVAVN